MASLPQLAPPGPERPRRRAATAPVVIRRSRRPRLWMEIVIVLLCLLAGGWALRKAAVALTTRTAPRLVGAWLLPAATSAHTGCHPHA
ncbi:MAG: hypothetical protein ACRD2E_04845 [Terriglobales bacterium]